MSNEDKKELEKVSGDLMQEIDENQLEDVVAGAKDDNASKRIARVMGLGSNYGRNCTLSAECATTISCG